MGIKKIIFIALAPTGVGISGSDRIFIELARNWSNKNKLEIITTTEGYDMIERQNLSGKKLKITNIGKKVPSHFLLRYLWKIVIGIKYGLFQKIGNHNQVLIYSSSDFWMDVFPAVLLKLRYKNIKWLATWYQTAPNPIKGFSEGAKRDNNYNLSAFLYWFVQLPVKPLIKSFADYVIVNNDSEKQQFSSLNKKGRVLVLIGAVRLEDIKKYQRKSKVVKKIYSAVFQGRFHPQKGVVELVKIWQKVVKQIPDAQLAMIGDGPLMIEVQQTIKKLKLDKNITLCGYMFDGDKKYHIFSQSKLVVHPAYYDSGGMASAEAMAFGIPGVGFDLKAYESYYPKGMVKVKEGDLDLFAKKIIELLKNSLLRNKLGLEAKSMIEDNWSWNKRANQLFANLK